MPSPNPEKVTLSIKIKQLLRQIANCTTNAYRLVRRAKIILEADLKQKILDFIEYFNQYFGKPFVWKFKGYQD